MNLLVITNDAQDNSCFSERGFVSETRAPTFGVADVAMIEFETSGNAVLMDLDEKHNGAPHPAPGRHLWIMMRGEISVTVSTGECRTLRAGDIVLIEDTVGPGHASDVVSSGGAAGVLVPLAGPA